MKRTHTHNSSNKVIHNLIVYTPTYPSYVSQLFPLLQHPPYSPPLRHAFFRSNSLASAFRLLLVAATSSVLVIAIALTSICVGWTFLTLIFVANRTSVLLSSESLLYSPAYEMLYADCGIWVRVWVWFRTLQTGAGTCDFSAADGAGCRGAEMLHCRGSE
jgi:hypothetical protein